MRSPRGSEWRKWDLHVHAPGTKLSDGYLQRNGTLDWQQFCEIIHDSDVSAIGITDYFSLDGYFTFLEKYAELYPNDKSKVFFPNIELRLPETLNDCGSSVNIHILLRPDLEKSDAERLLAYLFTETTEGRSKRIVACRDLKATREFESATVSRASIEDALRKTFGTGEPLENSAMIITSAKGDGIRPGKKGSKKRKYQLVDEIDKMSSAFFAGPKSRPHFLRTDRLESDETIPAKPVFGGCDAHSFEQLRARLGKHKDSGVDQFHTTWIKAELTYEGLLQTLVEPEHRVALQASQPDYKQPYQYISRITFSGSNDFPSEIVFNPGLNAIIGSRSSGKSALLAYLAHAVDPEMTIRQQVEATGADCRDAGPAAGKTWEDVSHIRREVEWGAADALGGRVIYIPQNSLYLLSEHPDKVTQKIQPALFRCSPDFESIFRQSLGEVASVNEAIRQATREWFSIGAEIERLENEIRDLGDKQAVCSQRDELARKVELAKCASELTADEVETYRSVGSELAELDSRREELEDSLKQLGKFVEIEGSELRSIKGSVRVAVSVTPGSDQLPAELGKRIEEYCAKAEAELSASVEQAIVAAMAAVLEERARAVRVADGLREQHKDLISKHNTNASLVAANADLEKQVETLRRIERKEGALNRDLDRQLRVVERIEGSILARSGSLDSIRDEFLSSEHVLEGLSFGIEIGPIGEQVDAISAAFNRGRVSAYIPKKGETVDWVKAQGDPGGFLSAIRDGLLELNKGYQRETAAQEVLALTPEVRFTAVLDADIIGGFGRSTMTPGKQALFALTLILNESQEPWPLLIDQPEDDLDSRSIYDTIVPYLVERKRERQIIMVSHDANLVVGADSEEVLVANRHGEDRPNFQSRTFDYLTGALEDTRDFDADSPTVLGRCGVREHACEILDGGEEAFQKRKDKYKI